MPRSTIVLSARVQPDMMEYVRAMAQAEHLTPNAWLIEIIEMLRDGRLVPSPLPRERRGVR